MKYLFSILLCLFVSIGIYSQTDNSETIPHTKVILSVNAVVNATVKYENDGNRINEDLNCQLVETVEYEIVSNNGKGDISLERISSKNRMTALGKGSVISHSEGVGENRDDYTFSIDPEVSYRKLVPESLQESLLKYKYSFQTFTGIATDRHQGHQDMCRAGKAMGLLMKLCPLKKCKLMFHLLCAGYLRAPKIWNWK